MVKVNTVLLCIIIGLQVYSMSNRHSQPGRFQWLDTPGKQLGFDSVTGTRCWIWVEATDKEKLPPSDIPLCSDLAKK